MKRLITVALLLCASIALATSGDKWHYMVTPVNTKKVACTGTDKFNKYSSGQWFCTPDQEGAAGGGITSLNGAIVSTQSFANGANISVTTNTGTGVHTIAATGLTTNTVFNGYSSHYRLTVTDAASTYLTKSAFAAYTTGTTSATYQNVVDLWTSCTSGYLKYDGTCASSAGPKGDTGDTGPNNITTSTTTNLTGFLKGNGSVVSADNSTYLTSVSATNLDAVFTGNGWLKRTGTATYTEATPTYSDVGALAAGGTAANSSGLEGHAASYFQTALTNPVTGSSTTDYWPYYSGSTALTGVSIAASKVICSDTSKHPVACSNLTDTAIPSVYSWALASTKPTYTYSEVGADASGAAAAVTTTSIGAVPTTRTVAGKALSGNITIASTDLSDTSIASPATGQVLTYNGTAWINSASSSSQGGASNLYYFCPDVIFSGTSPTWKELETNPDSGDGNFTATVNNSTYTEIVRNITPALGVTTLPGGTWSFSLLASIPTNTATVKVDLYRVDSTGTIVGGIMKTLTSTSGAVNSTAQNILLSGFLSKQTGWSATDRVGVVVSAIKVTGANATFTLYATKSAGQVSTMTSPISVLHNQLLGLNNGDYIHLTAAQASALTPITGLSTTTPSMDGSANYGSGTTVARADHIHPTDTSRASVTDPSIAVGSSLSAGTGAGFHLAGSSLTAGSIYYMASGGLTLAKADSATTMPGVCIASSTTTCKFSGVYKFASSQSWTAGQIVYVSASSAGALVTTAPATSGNQIQRVGVALANDTILIMPSLDVGTVQ